MNTTVTAVITAQSPSRKPIPEKSGRPTMPWATPDGERVHEGRGETGVGPDEGDAPGDERIVAERPGEKEERRQEDERLLGDADRAAADGEDDGEERHDERLVPPEPPDQGADAGLDDAGPVEDAERAADDEDVEDDLGDLAEAPGEGQDERAEARPAGPRRRW